MKPLLFSLLSSGLFQALGLYFYRKMTPSLMFFREFQECVQKTFEELLIPFTLAASGFIYLEAIWSKQSPSDC